MCRCHQGYIRLNLAENTSWRHSSSFSVPELQTNKPHTTDTVLKHSNRLRSFCAKPLPSVSTAGVQHLFQITHLRWSVASFFDVSLSILIKKQLNQLFLKMPRCAHFDSSPAAAYCWADLRPLERKILTCLSRNLLERPFYIISCLSGNFFPEYTELSLMWLCLFLLISTVLLFLWLWNAI